VAFWDWFKSSWEPITEQTAPVTEASSMIGYDPDQNHTAAQVGTAYSRRLSGEHASRDMTPMSADKARDTATALYIMHGLGKRIPDIYRDWIVGTGMTVEVEPDQEDISRRDRKPTLGPDGEPLTEATPAPNDISGRAKRRQRERQEVCDTFWHDPDNNLDMELGNHVLDLSVFGERLINVAVNPVNGHVKLGVMDTGVIQCVHRDPFSANRPHSVQLKSTPDKPKRLKCIRIDDDASSETFGRRVGVKVNKKTGAVETYKDETGATHEYVGSCFLWQINKLSTAERGNSDLTCVIDYLDALDQMHFSEIDRNQLAKTIVFDVAIESGDETVVQQRMKELHANPPKPGTVIVHNNKEVWTIPSATLNAWDYQAFVEVIWNHIAASTGIPKHWIAATVDVNKATATEMSEPTIKTLETRQRFVIEMLQELCSFALDQAELAGRISTRRTSPGRLPTAWPLKVTAPEIRTRDMAASAKAISDLSTGLSGLITAGIVDVQAVQPAAVSIINTVGTDIDLESMRERLEVAQVTQADEDAEARDAETQAQIAVKKAAPPPMPVRRAG
jgi:hypothetical protein